MQTEGWEEDAADRGRDVSEPLETDESHDQQEEVSAAGDYYSKGQGSHRKKRSYTLAPQVVLCMIRHRTARGLKLGEATVRVNVSGLLDKFTQLPGVLVLEARNGMAGLITRVLVVDDYKAWRSFFTTTLQKEPGLQVIGQLSDGLEAVREAQELQPDLILLDIGLPTLNGIEAAGQIRKVSPASKILFVSENRSADIAEEALSTSAGGYVVKSDAASELLDAVKAVLQGERFVSASLAGHVRVTSNTQILQGRHRIEDNPCVRFAGNALISEFLISIIEATGADCGTVQLFDSTNRVLRIVAQQGFDGEFLNQFDTAGHDDQSAFNEATRGRSRIVVTDVASDPVFSDHVKDLLLRANIHSLQSTPLIDSSGELIGIVTTHNRCPGTPSPDQLKYLDNLVISFVTKISASA
jgi:DNA-binding NarL/FixJ family response regulator